MADEVIGGGVLDPAFGLGCLGLELRDGFYGVARDGEFGVVGVEFVGGVFSPGEGAVGFFVEAGTHRLDGAGEEGVVCGVGVEDLEAGVLGGATGSGGGG